MSDQASARESMLERYREYLQLIARLEVDGRFIGKLDFSGVVQQTLLEAHQGWGRYRGTNDSELLAWLRRILGNNLIDEMRRLSAQARDVQRERSLDAGLDESSARVEKWLAADQSSPSERMMREEQMCRMACALAQLADDQRLAVELHHLRGMSLAEVAEQMDRTRGAVAALIFRGLESIRKILDDDQYQPPGPI